MSRRSILGKLAALTWWVALVSAFVYIRAGGELLHSISKSEPRATSDKRVSRRDRQSIWAPDFPPRGGLHGTPKTIINPVMQGYKSAIMIPTVNSSFGSNADEYSTIDAAETAPILGFPDIPGMARPQQLEAPQ